jgi:hypothetical protein
MSFFACCRGTGFAAMSRAAAKAAGSRLRHLGLLREAVDWSAKATICESCPMRRVVGGISYCGKPFLRQIERDHAEEGCGCPTREKARSPGEHCPLDWNNRAARFEPEGCNCKWCNTYCE